MRDRTSDKHRHVAVAKLGRPLKPNEIVHHVDENKANNSKANLEVEDRGKHTAAHNKSRGLSKMRRALRGEVKLY